MSGIFFFKKKVVINTLRACVCVFFFIHRRNDQCKFSCNGIPMVTAAATFTRIPAVLNKTHHFFCLKLRNTSCSSITHTFKCEMWNEKGKCQPVQNKISFLFRFQYIRFLAKCTHLCGWIVFVCLYFVLWISMKKNIQVFWIEIMTSMKVVVVVVVSLVQAN